MKPPAIVTALSDRDRRRLLYLCQDIGQPILYDVDGHAPVHHEATAGQVVGDFGAELGRGLAPSGRLSATWQAARSRRAGQAR